MIKKLIFKTISVLIICTSFVLSSCGCKADNNDTQNEDDTTQVDKHTHTPSTEWSKDDKGHWHTCSNCDEKLDYAAHTFGDWKIVKEATCLEDGEKERICSICGYVEKTIINKTGHKFDETVWKSDETNHWHECKNCEEKRDIAKHEYGEAVIKKEATCTEEGIKESKCKVCGYIKTESIPKKEHDYDEAVVIREPTCKDEGVKVQTCKICGHKKEILIPKVSHTVNTKWSYDNLHHWHECSVCGERFDEEIHTYVTKFTSPATCSEEGYILKECACGHKVKIVIPMLPHTSISNIKFNSPTLAEDGSMSGTCICGKVITLRFPSIKAMIANNLLESLKVSVSKEGSIKLNTHERINIYDYILNNHTEDFINKDTMLEFDSTVKETIINYTFPTTTVSIKEGTKISEGAIIVVNCGQDLGTIELGPIPIFDKNDTENFRSSISGSKTRYYMSDACITNLIANEVVLKKNSYVIDLLKNFSLIAYVNSAT